MILNTIVLPRDANGKAIPVLTLDSAGDQTLDFSDESVLSEPIDAERDRIVLLCATQPCFVAIGAEENLIAQAFNFRLPANEFLYLVVRQGHRIAAVSANDNEGELHISPCA